MGKHSPVSVTCYLTDSCNSRCLTCTVWRRRRRPDAPVTQWRHVLSQLGMAGVRYACFSGGEPLLYADLDALIHEARASGMTAVEIATNGLYLTQERFQQLVLAGLTGMHLSVDGIGHVHDRIRGVPSAFEYAIKSLEMARNMGLRISINMNLISLNLHQVADVIQLARDNEAVWHPNLINDTQHAFKGIDKAYLSIDKSAALSVDGVLALELDRDGRAIGLKNHHLPLLAQLLTGERTSAVPCLLGHDTIYVYPDLSVSPGCNVLQPIGSLKDQPLLEIVMGDPYQKRIQVMEKRLCPGCTCGVWCNYDRALTHCRLQPGANGKGSS